MKKPCSSASVLGSNLAFTQFLFLSAMVEKTRFSRISLAQLLGQHQLGLGMNMLLPMKKSHKAFRIWGLLNLKR